MSKSIAVIVLLCVLFGVFIVIYPQYVNTNNFSQNLESSNNQVVKDQISDIQVTTENLNVPWEMAFLPNGDILVTERVGNLRLIKNDQGLVDTPVYKFESVYLSAESGLLGMTVHPLFNVNNFIYFYYTYKDGTQVYNRVVRFSYTNNGLNTEKIIVDKIPGANIHDGGRIKFGPDGKLYISTGDANNQSLPQDINSLAGKILRVNDDGSTPLDNPFSNLVFSYGHRNPEGLTWDDKGNLWESEHGPSANDEINKIEKGKNYGWPLIRGNETKEGLETAYINSGNDTWAPSGIVYINGKLVFGGLRGQSLFVLTISDQNKTLKNYYKGEYGRIRAVDLGSNGYIYFSTSNRDGRGNPKNSDDKIIRFKESFL